MKITKNCKGWWGAIPTSIMSICLATACDSALNTGSSSDSSEVAEETIDLIVSVEDASQSLALSGGGGHPPPSNGHDWMGEWTITVLCNNGITDKDDPYFWEKEYEVSGSNMTTKSIPIIKGAYCSCRLDQFIGNWEHFNYTVDQYSPTETTPPQPGIEDPKMGPSSVESGIESTVWAFQLIDGTKPQKGEYTEGGNHCRYGMQLKRIDEIEEKVDFMEMIQVRGDWLNAPSFELKPGYPRPNKKNPLKYGMLTLDFGFNCLEHMDTWGDETSCQGVETRDLMFALITEEELGNLFDHDTWAYTPENADVHWELISDVYHAISGDGTSSYNAHMLKLPGVVAQAHLDDEHATIEYLHGMKKQCSKLALILKNGPKKVCDELMESLGDCDHYPSNEAELFSFQIFKFKACIPVLDGH